MPETVALPPEATKFIQERATAQRQLQVEIESICKFFIGNRGGDWELSPDATQLISKV